MRGGERLLCSRTRETLRSSDTASASVAQSSSSNSSRSPSPCSPARGVQQAAVYAAAAQHLAQIVQTGREAVPRELRGRRWPAPGDQRLRKPVERVATPSARDSRAEAQKP